MRGRSVFYPMGWDDNGLPTERRVQNYYGVLCDPSLPYDPDFERADPRRAALEGGAQGADGPHQPAELHRSVQPPHRGGREGLRAPVPHPRAVGRLGPHLRDHRRALPAGGPAGLPAQPRAGRGLPGRGPGAVGRRLPLRRRPGRARGPRAARAPTTGSRSSAADDGDARLHRDHPPRAASPPAWPSSPTPTTSATSRCSAPRCAPRCSASRCEVHPHELADPEKGSGIAMICTFGDVTDVVWWRELQLPTRSVVGRERPPPHRDPVVDRRRRRRRRGRLRRAGRAQREAGPAPHRRAARRGRRARRRPQADHPPGEVLREGRAPPRDHHQPPVVPAQRRPRRRPARRPARAGPGAALAPAAHAGPLRELGERPQRRLAGEPPAVLRGAVPALVPARRRRAPPLRPADPRRRGVPARRPLHRRARPATTSPSATSPAASPATPT